MVLICLMIVGFFALKPLGIISKDVDYFIFDDDTELSKFLETNFFINIGDDRKIKIDFKGDGKKYVGVAYLPGDTDVNDCYLSWENEDVVVIKKLKHFKSGQYQIAGVGYDSVFFVKTNKKKYDFMLTTIQGSNSIDSLFINIDEDKGTIEEMNSDLEHNTECFGTASFNDNDYCISIKGRGNATWFRGEKKPYNITFFENDNFEEKIKVNMIEDEKSKKWSLLANYADPSLLRNRIGYSLANDMGVGLLSKYYDVWMNGEYLGNYLITPKNDYKASKNGFILELDNHIDNEDPQFHLSNGNGIIKSLLFTVKDDSGKFGTEKIKEWMQKAWDAIEKYDSEEYQQYIDIESWAKVYLLHELYKNYDVVNGSILMHRDGEDINDKLIAGPIWDLDNALGTVDWNDQNGMDFEHSLSADYKYIESVNLNNNNYCLLQELYKHESFKKEVTSTYEKYKDRINKTLNQIDSECEELNMSIEMNNMRWPVNKISYNNYKLKEYLEFANNDHPTKFFATNDYYDYLENLKIYVKARIEFMEENY